MLAQRRLRHLQGTLHPTLYGGVRLVDDVDAVRPQKRGLVPVRVGSVAVPSRGRAHPRIRPHGQHAVPRRVGLHAPMVWHLHDAGMCHVEQPRPVLTVSAEVNDAVLVIRRGHAPEEHQRVSAGIVVVHDLKRTGTATVCGHVPIAVVVSSLDGHAEGVARQLERPLSTSELSAPPTVVVSEVELHSENRVHLVPLEPVVPIRERRISQHAPQCAFRQIEEHTTRGHVDRCDARFQKVQADVTASMSQSRERRARERAHPRIVRTLVGTLHEHVETQATPVGGYRHIALRALRVRHHGQTEAIVCQPICQPVSVIRAICAGLHRDIPGTDVAHAAHAPPDTLGCLKNAYVVTVPSGVHHPHCGVHPRDTCSDDGELTSVYRPNRMRYINGGLDRLLFT